ncbi:hypothetical protein FCM35_KLT10865 [Carex littledalei]|uniref:Uncharacterized protein n=1 Tax=Carex littledalei TaxID=544730 RepID=A0A833QJV5_9POAL|nr:hypothetical protein FCM35_KLT10865 [Carex littledalei]
MLILELGIWALPFTLLVAPIRRLVCLVAKIQRLFATMATTSRSQYEGIWTRLSRLDSSTILI